MHDRAGYVGKANPLQAEQVGLEGEWIDNGAWFRSTVLTSVEEYATKDERGYDNVHKPVLQHHGMPNSLQPTPLKDPCNLVAGALNWLLLQKALALTYDHLGNLPVDCWLENLLVFCFVEFSVLLC